MVPLLSETPCPAIRPALLDLRFVGDPWIVDDRDGTASVCLDDYSLTRLAHVELDLPSLISVWTCMRLRQRQRAHRQ